MQGHEAFSVHLTVPPARAMILGYFRTLVKKLKLLLWPYILFQAKIILFSHKNDATLPFYLWRLNFLLNEMKE